MTSENRNLIRTFKKRIYSLSTDNESCSKLTMGELISAILKIKCKGVAGPDGIPPTFLKALGLIVSFLYVDCPRIGVSLLSYRF